MGIVFSPEGSMNMLNVEIGAFTRAKKGRRKGELKEADCIYEGKLGFGLQFCY